MSEPSQTAGTVGRMELAQWLVCRGYAADRPATVHANALELAEALLADFVLPESDGFEVGEPSPKPDVAARYRVAPPIVQAAIVAMLDFEESVDPMGYDLDYFQEDLPRVVAAAIKPWESLRVLRRPIEITLDGTEDYEPVDLKPYEGDDPGAA